MITIDISIYTRSGAAVGTVHGKAEFTVIPQAGSIISFDKPTHAGVSQVNGFSSHLIVEKIIYYPNEHEPEVLLLLEDVFADDIDQARAIMSYLEAGFGIISSEF